MSDDVASAAPPVAPTPGPDAVRLGPFDAAGHAFAITTEDTDLAAALEGELVDLRTADPDGGDDTTELLVTRTGPAWMSHPWGVWRDGEPCETAVTADYIRPYVLWEVTRLVLEGCGPFIPVHAAAVARDGQAIVLAGVSHAGKSTLSAWLTAHGWSFLTDEVALLDRRDDGSWWVRPFHRPIGVRRPSPLLPLLDARTATEATELMVPASTFGPLAGPTPLAAIVFPDRDDDVPRELRAAHPATAVRELAGHLPRLGVDGRAGFRAIVDLVGTVPAHTLGVDDLDRAAATLTDLVREAHP